MHPAIEKMLRLVALLPSSGSHELWDSIDTDTGELLAINTLKGQVAASAKGSLSLNAARGVASDLLWVFASPSERTLQLIAGELGVQGAPVSAGRAFVDEVRSAAIGVLAGAEPLDDVVQRIAKEWAL